MKALAFSFGPRSANASAESIGVASPRAFLGTKALPTRKDSLESSMTGASQMSAATANTAPKTPMKTPKGSLIGVRVR